MLSWAYPGRARGGQLPPLDQKLVTPMEARIPLGVTVVITRLATSIIQDTDRRTSQSVDSPYRILVATVSSIIKGCIAGDECTRVYLDPRDNN
ncbi:jg11018 [Pararge aegeria aegeria]|uniref:Jg11018 protein n=1 Tax=Pararge aegeria aegeria TaxID=348720 RepID=A0A8S4S691_9NEOP|nr:jg11018 [Pararge aegeria aegeria]